MKLEMPTFPLPRRRATPLLPGFPREINNVFRFLETSWSQPPTLQILLGCRSLWRTKQKKWVWEKEQCDLGKKNGSLGPWLGGNFVDPVNEWPLHSSMQGWQGMLGVLDPGCEGIGATNRTSTFTLAENNQPFSKWSCEPLGRSTGI
jgi:hypothetical protein